MKYHLIGAFNRHNYGDILFANITEKIIKDVDARAQIFFYSPFSGDATPWGGPVAESTLNLQSKSLDCHDIVVLTGGDVLAIDWVDTTYHSTSKLIGVLLKALRRSIGPKKSNILLQNFLRNRWRMPFLPENLNGNVVWLTLGGSGLDKKGTRQEFARQMAFNAARKIDNLKVREKKTKLAFEGAGIHADLAPDPVFALAKYYPEDPSIKVDEIIFQCAYSYGSNFVIDIAKSLIALGKKHKCKIVLLPIGLAVGHDDGIILRKIEDAISSLGGDSTYHSDTAVDAIRRRIAKAQLYIGSSLHGFITSQIYGVPCVGIFCRQVIKLDGHINTWAEGPAVGVEGHDFFAAADKLLTEKVCLIRNDLIDQAYIDTKQKIQAFIK